MEALSIEEKAKRYDEAIELAREINNEQRAQPFDVMLKVFPELKESDDESIRKALITYFSDENESYNGIPYPNILAWLEKQGEHANFRNKIQIGDKVTRNEDGMLVNLSQLKRVAKKDEKQGEQKPAESRQETKPNGGVVYEDFNEGDGYYKVNLAYLSKSQVELIENLVASWQNLTNNAAEWSEEDEEMSKKVETAIDSYYAPFSRDTEEMSEWFKNLKDRVQPKQGWSKDDEKEVAVLEAYIRSKDWSERRIDRALEIVEELVNKVKYSRRKPTEEQIDALEHFVRSVGESGCASPYDRQTKLLYSLLEQLKQL